MVLVFFLPLMIRDILSCHVRYRGDGSHIPGPNKCTHACDEWTSLDSMQWTWSSPSIHKPLINGLICRLTTPIIPPSSHSPSRNITSTALAGSSSNHFSRFTFPSHPPLFYHSILIYFRVALIRGAASGSRLIPAWATLLNGGW